MDKNPERRRNYDANTEAACHRIAEKYVMAERARCLKAVDDEPELPDAMPEEMKSALQRLLLVQDWEAVEEAFRITARQTKANIRKRIEEGACQ